MVNATSTTNIITPLRLSLIPGVALGGIIGSIVITNVVTRISQRNERTSLFVKRRARRRCPRCGGFGIVRCNLCQGEAMVVSPFFFFFHFTFYRFEKTAFPTSFIFPNVLHIVLSWTIHTTDSMPDVCYASSRSLSYVQRQWYST